MNDERDRDKLPIEWFPFKAAALLLGMYVAAYLAAALVLELLAPHAVHEAPVQPAPAAAASAATPVAHTTQ
jgi:hypothetical protein